MKKELYDIKEIENDRVLMKLGDYVKNDNI
jgi:hypothetical protein